LKINQKELKKKKSFFLCIIFMCADFIIGKDTKDKITTMYFTMNKIFLKKKNVFVKFSLQSYPWKKKGSSNERKLLKSRTVKFNEVQKKKKTKQEQIFCLKPNWINFEMKSNQSKHQTFQILYQIIKNAKPFWILTLLYIQQWTDFVCLF
jgi:hypothetical protein